MGAPTSLSGGLTTFGRSPEVSRCVSPVMDYVRRGGTDNRKILVVLGGLEGIHGNAERIYSLRHLAKSVFQLLR